MVFIKKDFVCFFREEDELSQSSRHSNMSNSGGSANGSSSFFHGSESVQAGREEGTSNSTLLPITE